MIPKNVFACFLVSLFWRKFKKITVTVEEVCPEERKDVKFNKKMPVHCPDTGLNPHLSPNSRFLEQC